MPNSLNIDALFSFRGQDNETGNLVMSSDTKLVCKYSTHYRYHQIVTVYTAYM